LRSLTPSAVANRRLAALDLIEWRSSKSCAFLRSWTQCCLLFVLRSPFLSLCEHVFCCDTLLQRIPIRILQSRLLRCNRDCFSAIAIATSGKCRLQREVFALATLFTVPPLQTRNTFSQTKQTPEEKKENNMIEYEQPSRHGVVDWHFCPRIAAQKSSLMVETEGTLCQPV
jgi:hypothetical protein